MDECQLAHQELWSPSNCTSSSTPFPSSAGARSRLADYAALTLLLERSRVPRSEEETKLMEAVEQLRARQAEADRTLAVRPPLSALQG